MSSKEETTVQSKKSSINPFSIIEDILKKRSMKKRKKELQLQLAILSGGITRMK